MTIDKGYIAGSSRLLVLKLLEEKSYYGYEMIKTLKQRSDHIFDMKEGTLYPILHKLENDGYIVSSQVLVDSRNRKVYTITTKGLKELKKELEQYKQFSLAMNHVLTFGVV